MQKVKALALSLLPMLGAVGVMWTATPTPCQTAEASTGGSSENLEKICPADEPRMDKNRYLRALSLDLRGYGPSDEEYMSLAQSEDVPEVTLDAWLDDTHFVERVQRLHQALLWNNVTAVRLISDNMRLGASSSLYYRSTLSQTQRGLRVPCQDKPQDSIGWDEDGYPLMETLSDGSRREGYVMATPYWAPTTSIKVCALDAQTWSTSRTTGVACGVESTSRDLSCGCGPNLMWCGRTEDEKAVLEGFAQDVRLRIADVIANDRSYLELFTQHTMYVNGPMVHYFRNQSRTFGQVRLQPLPVKLEVLPDLKYTDTQFVPVPLGAEHAGVLTAPAYLLRFMTNRARANHFFNDFMCQPFVPPEGGIPVTAPPTLDLQEREGCKYCHAMLEPSASYWGRWGESGAGYLPEERFPALRDDCLSCAQKGGCSDECSRYYVVKALTSEETPWLGKLRWYEFRHEEHEVNVEEGPSLLASQGVMDNRLPTCVARRASEWLLGRALTSDDDEEWLKERADHFRQSGYSYKSLVRDIVTSSVYRRVQ